MKKTLRALCVLGLLLQTVLPGAPAFSQVVVQPAVAGNAVTGAVGFVGAVVPRLPAPETGLLPSAVPTATLLPSVVPAPNVQSRIEASAAPSAVVPGAALVLPVPTVFARSQAGAAAVVSTPKTAAAEGRFAASPVAAALGNVLGAEARGREKGETTLSLSIGKVLFDGSRRYADAELPSAQGAARAGAVRAVDEARLAPAAELENGRTASGLAPPVQVLSLDDYRPPVGLMLSRTVLRASHLALLAASYAALGFGIGGYALAVAAVWVGGGLYLEYRRSAPPADAAPAPEAQDEYTVWLRGLLGALTGRLGLPAEKTPRMVVSNERGAFGASSFGKALDASADVAVGEGFSRLPVEQTLGVLAHELGHLVLGDFHASRVFQNRLGFQVFLEILRDVSMRGGLVLVGEALAGIIAWKAAFIGALLGLAAFPVAVLGLALGLAVSRREELRADHFSGWLTDPRWMADFLRGREAARKESLAAPEGFFARLWRHLSSTHPSNEERIRRLERAAQGQH